MLRIPCCVQMFQSNSLGNKAGKDVLRDVMTSLVTLLLDDRLMELDDGPQVVRSVNVTVVKMVERADPTNIMGYATSTNRNMVFKLLLQIEYR